jgi:dimethyladenosine transferase
MNLTDETQLRALLKRHGFRFDKHKGQNFLVADWVPVQIAETAELDEDSLVLEIGPGIGTLTQELCKRAGRIVSVELDRNLLPILDETLADFKNATILSGDFLKLDLAEALAPIGDNKPVLCANLPYNITTPILVKAIESKLFSKLTVMIQREVALRICAAPGTSDYGAFTLYCNYYTRSELQFEVPPDCFLPAPKVTSAVITMDLLEKPTVEVADERLLFALIKAAFAQRRKTLVNALFAVYGNRYSKEDLVALLAGLGLSADVRGERLSLEQFAQLANAMTK